VSETPGSRLSILWSPQARTELRAIDRSTALDILHCIDRCLIGRAGDVKKLKSPQAGFRLRCEDYRVFFEHRGEIMVEILGVRHRGDAYR
jgi:mRNA-degrading endonuclease RelE of RelBE toxin-antitoxin system